MPVTLLILNKYNYKHEVVTIIAFVLDIKVMWSMYTPVYVIFLTK